MQKMAFAEIYISCELLIDSAQFERVVKLLNVAILSFDDPMDWSLLLKLLKRISNNTRIELLQVSLLYAKALVKNLYFEELFDFCDHVLLQHGKTRVASIQVQKATALYQNHQYYQAQDIIQSSLPYLQSSELGFALGQLGLALFQLNKPWQDAFYKARGLLTGVELGRALLNEGGCLSESNQRAEARTTWLEALPHFKSHPKLLAWTRYNLGISALQDLEPEAEHHFLEAVSLTKNPKAAEMRSTVFRGLGASRRVFGEWDRAEFAYRQAVQTATALDDREEAYIGLARTLRLSGRPIQALETLELALHIYDTETPIVNIGRALAFLVLNDTTHAKTALEKVGMLVSVSDQWLFRIASAELARREGHLTDAVGLLEGLPVHSLHPREEVRQWAKLFELLALADKPVPLPLEYVTRMVVRVQAQGALRVAVNGRGVQLVPTHRPGELLVFLLENDGVASLDQIRDALYPDAVDGKDKERTQKSIWKLVDALRHALGWESAVLSLRGAYQLDPNVTWDYDIAQAREAGRFKGEFLKGVYSNWAIETGQLLSELAPDPRGYRPLN